MPIVNLVNMISVIPVKDYDKAVSWYKKLFGCDADIVPMEGIAEWQLDDKAWIQVSIDPDNAGNTTLVINVADINIQHTECVHANLSPSEIIEYPSIIKMFDTIDPDGNKISFVQELSSKED